MRFVALHQGASSESPVSSTTQSGTHAHPFGLPSTPASALEEEDEPEECMEPEPRPESEAVPWHHEQLYRLYGKKADYFLYPKFEPEKKKMVGPMNPELRREGGKIFFALSTPKLKICRLFNVCYITTTAHIFSVRNSLEFA